MDVARTAGVTTITAAHPSSGVSGSTTLTVSSAELVSIAVAPPAPAAPVGAPTQLTAVGTYTDGTTQDLTSIVAWSSSNELVASVSSAAGSKGVARGLSTGSTTITATDPATGISATTALTVTQARMVSIAVTPTAPSVPLGSTKQFTATGTYTDGTVQDVTAAVTWSSSQAGVASISNAGASNGLASSATPGTTTIQAADAATGIAGSTTLTVTQAELVSIAVTPARAEVALGGAQQLTATGTYSDGSEQDLTSDVT